MKNIVIFIYSLDIGGIQRSLVSLLKSMDFEKYNVELVVFKKGVLMEEIPKEVKILLTPEYFKWLLLSREDIANSLLSIHKLKSNFFWYLFYLFRGVISGNMNHSRQKLYERVKDTIPSFEGEYDLAIDYSGNFKNIVVDKVLSRNKASWIHSDYRVYKTNKSLDGLYYEKLSKIVTVSETAKKIFEEEFPKYSNKVIVVQNITDKNYITRLSKRYYPAEYSKEVFNIVDVSRLDINKGIELSILSAKKLREKGLEFKWYIVGGGSHYNQLIKMIEEHNVRENFVLVGEKSNPYPYIANADIFVHCSYFEGKSIAIDESMLLGIPVIVTNYETAKDQIKNSVNGIIVEMNPNSIASAIINLKNDKRLYGKIKSNLLSFDFNNEDTLKNIEDMIG